MSWDLHEDHKTVHASFVMKDSMVITNSKTWQEKNRKKEISHVILWQEDKFYCVLERSKLIIERKKKKKYTKIEKDSKIKN